MESKYGLNWIFKKEECVEQKLINVMEKLGLKYQEGGELLPLSTENNLIK